MSSFVKRLLIIAPFIAIACLVFLGHKTNRDKTDRHLVRVENDWKSAIRRGDLNLAIEILEKRNAVFEPETLAALLGTYSSTGNTSKLEALILDFKHSPMLDVESVQTALINCAEARLLIGRGEVEKARYSAFSCYDLLIYSTPSIERDFAADAAHIIGLSFHESGDFPNALSWYSTSQTLRLPSSWYFEIGLAATLNNVGNILWKQGRVDEALNTHLNSLALKNRVLGPNHIDLSASLNNIGVILAELGDHERALVYHNRALEIRLAVAPNSRVLAHSYHNLALSHDKLGEHSRALNLINRALELKQSMFREEHYEVMNSQSLHALIRSSLGDYSASDSIYSRLIGFCTRSIRDICNDVFVDYMNRLGRTSIEDSTYQTAQRVHSLAKQSIGANSPQSVSLTSAYVRSVLPVAPNRELCFEMEQAIRGYWNLLESDMGQEAKSRHDLSRPIYLVQQLNLLSECYATLSENHLVDSSLYNRILNLSKASLELLEKGYSKDLPITPPSTLNNLARNAALNGLWAIAKTKHNNSAFFEEDVLLLSDYATNWSFQSAMYDLKALRLSGASDSEVRDLGQSLIEYFLPTSELLNSMHGRLDSGLLAGNSTRSKLLTKYPLFDVFRPRHRAFDLRKLKTHLENTQTTLVLYENIRESTYAIVFSDHEINLVNLGDKIATAELVNSIGALKRIVTMEDAETLRAGYIHFLQPIDTLSNRNSIQIVRNSLIERIPFESLISSMDSDSSNIVRYAIQDISFSYSYSISGVAEDDLRIENQDSAKKLFAVFPKFSQKTEYSDEMITFLKSVQKDSFDSSEILSALPGAQREVIEVANLFSRPNYLPKWVTGHVNIRSTNHPVESIVKKSTFRNYSHIHLATHSFVNSSDLSKSGIILEANGQMGEDGILRVEEVFSLDLNAELVVLSSCEAASEAVSVDGALNSFAKGFMFAGARNLVASMWQSDDFATLVLMRNFYAHVNDGYSTAKALRLAKLDLLEMGGPIANPYYWAGFIHIGAPTGIRQPGMTDGSD